MMEVLLVGLNKGGRMKKSLFSLGAMIVGSVVFLCYELFSLY